MVARWIYQVPRSRFGLGMTGEANEYVQILQRLVGPNLMDLYPVRTETEVMDLAQSGAADAVVLDEAAIHLDALRMLRMIRQVNRALLVVLLTCQADQRRLVEAMNLAAFSVVVKPLRLEELLNQVHRMMLRMEAELRRRR